MNAQFKPGDKVRVVNPEGGDGSLLYGAEHTVAHLCTESYTPNCRVHHLQLEGMGNIWWDQVRFEKVEPEWTVGQEVSGGDYPRLPIGSVVFDEPAAEDTVASVPVLKTGEDEWTNQGWPGVFTNAEMADDVRTLTRLGDGIADAEVVEPERNFFCCAAPSHIHGRIVMPTGERVETTLTVPPATADVEPAPAKVTGNSDGPHLHFGVCRKCGCTDEDCSGCIARTGHACSWVEGDLCSACADVEPEPLKEADAVLVWAKVANGGIQDSEDMFRVWINPDGARFALVVQVEPDAIVRPDAGQVPPWAKPAQCTSLKDMSDSVRIQCAKAADVLVHMHRAVYAGVEVHWPDDEAYGRVEVSS